MVSILGFIDNQLESLAVPYEFGEWTRKVQYPYFVGSFNEIEHRYEDGYTGGIFTIDGWARGKGAKIQLIEMSDKIKERFADLRAVQDGTAFFITSPTSLTVPTGEADLYKITITVNTNEWKGDT